MQLCRSGPACCRPFQQQPSPISLHQKPLSRRFQHQQVVLPEGAKDPKVSLDLPFQLEQSLSYTYLDVLGR